MPFPLAHPAAVLPFKRFSPRWLCLPALVVGSMTPDAAYLSGPLRLDELAHTVQGIVLFCLPAGLIFTLLFYAVRSRFLAALPGVYRRLLLAPIWKARPQLLVIGASVMLGAASHILWDSFTHTRGWGVELIPSLTAVVGTFAGHNVRVCRLLWYLSSFAGVAGVYFVYRNTLRRADDAIFPQNPGTTFPARRFDAVEAVFIAAFVLPIELVHDLVRGTAGMTAVGTLSVLLITGVLWLNSRHVNSATESQPGPTAPTPTI